MSATTLATPLADEFSGAVDATLNALQALVPLDIWMLTRVEADDWIVLHTRGRAPRFRPGAAFSWQHSYCVHMHAGEGPNVAADARSVPAYASAPINDIAAIGCYVGFPLHDAEGQLFGTLCGLHPEPVDPAIERHEPVIRALAESLSHVLRLSQRAEVLDRLRQHTALSVHSDPLTGVLNRHGWELALEAEETRCQRLGQPAGIIALDFFPRGLSSEGAEGHDDTELVRAILALQERAHPTDRIGRLGGGRFALLASEMKNPSLAERARSLQQYLADQGIPASVGYASREPGTGSLASALQNAARGKRNAPQPTAS
ncbi:MULTISPECIES: diguanylate cyclase domain-containing protein [unclassified Thioalkalivibrio]|uniref:GGDEF domain-containing protein n=1 Tax=unclassified Thioalkalivibrio TaxID=2621013 RepID=UPI000382E476|nr:MULTISPECIES: diguanylate cyclase [unclassified Thioalkalivibrio]